VICPALGVCCLHWLMTTPITYLFQSQMDRMIYVTHWKIIIMIRIFCVHIEDYFHFVFLSSTRPSCIRDVNCHSCRTRAGSELSVSDSFLGANKTTRRNSNSEHMTTESESDGDTSMDLHALCLISLNFRHCCDERLLVLYLL